VAVAFLLQLSVMRWRKGSLAEVFYGVVRRRKGAAASQPWLMSFALQAAVLAVWPLLQQMANDAVLHVRAEGEAGDGESGESVTSSHVEPATEQPTERPRGAAAQLSGEGTRPSAQTTRQRGARVDLRSVLRDYLPPVVGLLQALSAAQLLAYALDLSPHPSLATHALGLVVERPTIAAQQVERFKAERRLARDRAMRRRVGIVRGLLLRVADVGSAAVSVLTPLAAMSVTLALSVAARPSPPSERDRRLPLPPPPAVDHGRHERLDVGACARCGSRTPEDPVVLPAAGVVACHSCWVSLLDAAGGSCPYTGIAATPNDLRRVRAETE
jgi:hypothetical protein